jgi:hypothetical protein
VSTHEVPTGSKLCPYISTAQVLISELVFQAQAQKGMSIQGIAGVGTASAPDVTSGKAVAVHKNPILPEGYDPSKGPLDVSTIERFGGQPVSVPCNGGLGGQCEKWCAEHGASNCGAGCQQCKVAAMTQAFTAALEAQGESLGLASARRLLSKAHENYEENTQETPA